MNSTTKIRYKTKSYGDSFFPTTIDLPASAVNAVSTTETFKNQVTKLGLVMLSQIGNATNVTDTDTDTMT